MKKPFSIIMRTALPLVMAIVAFACNPIGGNNDIKDEPTITIELASVGTNSVSCLINIQSKAEVNFAGVRYALVDSEESYEKYLTADELIGENYIDITNMGKHKTYRIVAYADIVGQDSFVFSNTIEVTTGDPVDLQLISKTDNTITCKLVVNTPMNIYTKGYSWKQKSSKEDATIVYVEDSNRETEFTLTGLEKYQTYTITAFSLVEGNDSFTYSDPLEVFTGEIDIDGDYMLVFEEEFNGTGAPDASIWSFEEGEYIRNHEPQFYSKSVENAYQEGGYLHIVARKDHLGSDGKTHNYTSASMTTSKSFVWCYGKMEVRAKIPTGSGLWPAIWMVGNDYNWPSNGELDVMEYYREKILANAAWGSSKQWTAIWDSSSKPMSYFEAKNPNWRNEFHTWLTVWDEDYIRIYLDDELLNEIDLSKTFNQGGYKGNTENPFRYHKAGWGHYIWLNLALGGDNGGTIDDSLLPAEYLVDYVRVYQQKRLPE